MDVVGLEDAPDSVVELEQIANTNFSCQYFCHGCQHRVVFGSRAFYTIAIVKKNSSAVFSPACKQCARLADFLGQSRQKHPAYYNKPVPSFGPIHPRLLIVGLAPGLHGANRTGRPFTGDHAGLILYRTLYDFGFASAGQSAPHRLSHYQCGSLCPATEQTDTAGSQTMQCISAAGAGGTRPRRGGAGIGQRCPRGCGAGIGVAPDRLPLCPWHTALAQCRYTVDRQLPLFALQHPDQATDRRHVPVGIRDRLRCHRPAADACPHPAE